MVTELIGPVEGVEECPDCGLALESTLLDVLAELQTALKEGGEVSLSTATLTALENVTATVSGEVSLSGTTLAALETINAIVTGEVALDADTLTALENITAVVSGPIALDSSTVDALTVAPVFASGVADAVETVIDPIDVSDKAFISVQAIASTAPAWQSGLIVVEGTNDPAAAVGWAALRMETQNGATTTAPRAAGSWTLAVTTRWIRVRCTQYVAGSMTINLMIAASNRPRFLQTIKDDIGITAAAITPLTGALHVAQRTFLCGGDFDGTELEVGRWIETVVGSGGHAVGGGKIDLTTGVTPDSSVKLTSTRRASFLGGSFNSILMVVKVGDTGTPNNVKRWGVYDDNNGIFVEQYHDGTSGQITFKTRKDGVDAVSPFGILGINAPSNGLAFSIWEFLFDPTFVIIRQNGVLVQFFLGNASLSTLFSEFDLPLRAENLNSGGGATNTTLSLQSLVANRIGQPNTIRADENFTADDVLASTAALIQGQQPGGDFVHVRADGEALRTTTTLGPDGIFTSDWIDTDGWSSVELFVASDVASAFNGVQIDFSDDIGAGSPQVSATRIYTFSDVNVDQGFATFRFPCELDGCRIRYTNADVPQSEFLLVVTLRIELVPPQGSFEQPINETNTALMMRSVLAARNDDDEYGNIKRGDLGGLRTAINEHEVSTPIRPVSDLRTGRSVVSSFEPVALPSAPLMDRATVRYTNISEVMVFFSEDIGKLPNQGDVLLPQTTLELDLDDTISIYFQAEDAGGTTSTANRFGVSPVTSSSGVTNPNNAIEMDDARAIFDDLNDTLEIDGFTAVAGLDEIASIKIKLEARKATNALFEQVTYIDTVSGTAGNVGSVVSGTVTSNAQHFYLAAISFKNTAAAISSVSGLGLTWTLVGTVPSGSGDTEIAVYRGTGTPTGNGTVTAVFTTPATNSVISVSRFSGVDLSDPIDQFETQQEPGASASYADAILGTEFGLAYTAVSIGRRVHTVGSSFTERAETRTGTGPSDAALAVNTLELAATGSQNYSGTLDGTIGWSLVAITLNPASASHPEITVVYELSGVAGVTDLVAVLNDTADTTYEADISADRAWVFADIANVSLVVTATAMGVANAEVDAAYLEITEAEAGNSAIVAFSEVGGIL